ncbi:unnamed protein product [Prorocentrum cordatum]|uniref:ADP,ATP carrier protein n=1 Tax=Prorocentrum cordatum TaxID=2364126 RepID=A0ABN9XLD0_9DINO|nr:unnamed protein product [Polarella glacialis]
MVVRRGRARHRDPPSRCSCDAQDLTAATCSPALDVRDAALAGALVRAATTPLECVVAPRRAEGVGEVPLLSCREAAGLGARRTAARVLALKGWRGFFRGGLLDTLRGGAARGVTVGLVDSCRHVLGVPDVAAGALAGAAQTLLLYPLDVVQTVRRAGVGQTRVCDAGTLGILRLMASRGVPGLYPALGPSLAGFTAFYAVQFGARRPLHEATGSPFLAGFLGSSAACALCNWNNVVRLTMQRRAVEDAGPHLGWSSTLVAEYRAGGVRRFYAGFGVKVFQTAVNMGLVLALYEQLRAYRL